MLTKTSADATSCRRGTLLAICILALATGIYLNGVGAFGQALVPADLLAISEPWRSTLGPTDVHNPILADPIQAHYPRLVYFWAAVRQGHFPVWNPYIFLGIPSDPTTVGVFADTGQWVTSFPSLLLPLDLSLSVVAALRLVLTGFFMYLLMRHFKASFGGALLAAVVFMFGASTIAWLEFYHHLAAQLWMPLILLFFDRTLTRRCWTDAIFTSVFLALMLYNRYLQLTLYMLLLLFLFFLWHLWGAYRRERSWRAIGRMMLLATVAVGCALLMASAKIQVYYQTINSSIRGAQGGGRLSARPLDLSLLSHAVSRIVLFFSPKFYGDGIVREYWGPENSVEAAQYVGLLPLCLIAVSLACKPRRRGALFSAGVGLGLYLVRLRAPLFANLARMIPMLSWGSPTRLATVLTFLSAIVAGLGLTVLEREGRTRTRTVSSAVGGTLAAGIVVVGAAWWLHREQFHAQELVGNIWTQVTLTLALLLLLYLFLSKRVGKRLMVLGAVLLTFVDLFAFGGHFNTAVPRETVYPRTQATDLLRRDPTPFRVLVLHPPEEIMGVAPSNTLQAYQIPEIGGRNPLLPQQYYDFIAQVMQEPSITLNGYLLPAKFTRPALWGMLNVKYVLSNRDLPEEQLDGLHLVYANELRIYRNKEWLPRVFAVSDVRVLESEAALIEALQDPTFDPAHQGLLLRAPDWTSREAASCTPDDVNVVWVGTRDVEARTCLSQPSLLVFSTRYDPNWKAYVDGVQREVYRANSIIMAVPVEAGQHTVRFVYAPQSRWWNLAARTATPLLMAGAFLALRKQARRRGPSGQPLAARSAVLALSGLALASLVPVLLTAPMPERAQAPVTQVVETVFDDQVMLEGVILHDEAFASEGRVDLTLHWRALQAMGTGYTVFVHVVGPDGALYAQSDAPPLNGGYPTNIWQPGELVADHHSMTLPESAPPGEYQLAVGLYNKATMERLPALEPHGGRWDADSVWLDTTLLRPDR